MTYTTNAVKHFRWKADPRGGKRRIHEQPETGQVRACWPWLAAELARLKPRVVVTLGATPRPGGAGHPLHTALLGTSPVNNTYPSDHYALQASLRY